MNQLPRNRLYNLLPAIYRIRDAAEGEPLRALLEVIESELQTIETDIADLYDNWFIETCAEWVVPYIGDLLDVPELYADNPLTYGQQERRAYVANTLAYRRRKGTTVVLEQLTRDVTGWRAHAVEFSRLLMTAQNLNHIRPTSATVDLRVDYSEQLISTPFEQQAAYNAEVRRGSVGGRYNVRNIGLFVWRLQSYPIQRSTARAVKGPEAKVLGRYYTFNPLPYDMPLLNQPQKATDIIRLAEEINVPGFLRRFPLANELVRRRQLILQGEQITGIGYFDNTPVLQIFVNSQPNPIPPEEILICSLEQDKTNHNLPDTRPWLSTYDLVRRTDDLPVPTAVVAVDPELGRIAFLDSPPKKVEVSYLYGFNDDLGGGSYSRPEIASLPTPPSDNSNQYVISPLIWEVEQSTSAVPNPLATAIQHWNQTVQVWQGFHNQTCVPLARIIIPGYKILKLDPAQVEDKLNLNFTQEQRKNIYSHFTPGIIGDGLRVVIYPGSHHVIVTAGRAIDYQGRFITLQDDKLIDLTKVNLTDDTTYQGVLVLFYRSTWQKQSFIQFIPETALNGYQKGTFIPLTWLELDSQKHVIRQSNDIRQSFQPGIVQGFEVHIQPGTMHAVITAGRAVDTHGKRLSTTANSQFNLSSYQGESGFLLISRFTRGFKKQRPFEFVVVNDNVNHLNNLDNLNQTYIPLAYIDIPKKVVIKEEIGHIISGFEVKSPPGKLEIIVSSGTAKDSKGQDIKVYQDSKIDLIDYQGQTVFLVLGTGLQQSVREELKVVQPTEVLAQPDEYILLANLDVPSVNLSQTAQSVQIYPSGRILHGLGVQVNQDLRVSIQSGKAIDGQGREISCLHPYQFDLSSYPGRTLILFISQQTNQGFPIKPATHTTRQEWQKFGVVPQEPPEAEMGIIYIKDNCTYQGNLSITIPPARHLNLVTANGYRPHLQGDLQVRGSAKADNLRQGELMVEGLLIEGQLTVLPGYLKSLLLSHCTLVPQAGGLLVESGPGIPEETPPDDEDGTITPIAIVMYWLSFVWQMIYRDLGLVTPSQKTPIEIVQLILQQLTQLTAKIGQTIQHSLWLKDGEACDNWEIPAPIANKQDNSRLEITLKRSICGPLHITNSVPILNIQDSIIDKGQARVQIEQETSGMAIKASGTDVTITTSTVFGMTMARSLEVSDSLLTEKVTALRHQIGCVRFSYLSAASLTPRRYQCQPDMTFKNELDSLPKAITAMIVISSTALAGTAGDGIFCSLNSGDLWTDVNRDLANRDVTALFSYTKLGIGIIRSDGVTVQGISNTTCFSLDLQPGDVLIAAGQARTVEEILNESELKIDTPFSENVNQSTFQINTVLAGTTEGRIFRSKNSGNNWNSLNLTQTNATIAALIYYERLATGTISCQGTTITGKGTHFSSEVRVGDTMTVNQQTRLVVAIGQPGRGSISSSGTTVKLLNPPSASELKVGDTITALNQTRVIVKINPASSNINTLVEVDAPFGQDLPTGTPFTLNVDTVLEVNAAFDNELLTKVPFKIHNVLAATIGSGIFKANDNGENWEPVNSGLTNLNVTALGIHPVSGQLFAGTGGDGVFQLIKEISQDGILKESWTSVDIGLKKRYISTLTFDTNGQLFAGTDDSGVFRFTSHNNSWLAENQGLTSLSITTLLACQFQGKNLLFAGTTDGKVFLLADGSQSWQQKNLDLRGIDITVLAANSENGELFAGTAAGDILHSLDEGDNWFSINNGLPNVAQKLQIMGRLQPNFTSTHYGDPGYAQLSQNCAIEIYKGAEDGAEMGVFNSLKQPQREANLQASLKESLRFGLEVGTFYVT